MQDLGQALCFPGGPWSGSTAAHSDPLAEEDGQLLWESL